MRDYTISDDELKRAAAALLYVKEHGADYDLAESIGSIIREWNRENVATGFQRQGQAIFLGDHLRRFVGNSISRERCQAAAEAVLVGSRERAVIDEILRFARALRDRVEQESRSRTRR